MSKEYYFEKYYKDVDFTTEESKVLKSQFLEFGALWNLSIVFIKRNFKRVFLSPALWQLLMGVVAMGVVILFSLNTILNTNPDVFRSIAESVRNQPEVTEMMSDKQLSDTYGYAKPDINLRTSDQSVTGKTNIDSTENSEEIGKLGLSLFGALMLYLLFAIVLSVVYSLIYLRQIYIANSKSVESIWKTPRGFYLDLLKLIVILIIYGIGSGIISAIFSSISEQLGSLTSIIVQTVAHGYFGLCAYLLVIEKEGLMESVQLSLKLMKPIFWQNIGRWALLLLVMFGIGIGIAIVLLIVGFILFFIGMSLKGAALIGFVILSAFIFMILIFGLSLITNSLSFTFSYISFVNIRMYRGNVMLESREDETEQAESEVVIKTETLESVDVKEEVVTAVEGVHHSKKTHKVHKAEEEKQE